MEKNKSLQFYARKTQKDILEIREWFDEGKVCIGFRQYNNNADSGNKVTGSVDFYMQVEELDLLCHNILSGNVYKTLAAGKNIPAYYKGNKRGDTVYARTLTFSKSNRGVFITACEGEGEIIGSGAVKPLYTIKDAPVKVSISLTVEELKAFAIQGRRSCDYYYMHCFGR